MPRLLFLLIVLAVTSLWSSFAMSAESERSVALTFDDLPYVSSIEASRPGQTVQKAIDINGKIIASLKRRKAPATGFVIETSVRDLGRAPSLRILRAWTQGSFDLGNHTFSHPDINGLEMPAIEREIVDGEATSAALMRQAGKRLRYVRFPMNHTGDTAEKQAAIQAFLGQRGNVAAAATIDTSDYVFARAYDVALARGAKDDAGRIRQAYLDHTARQIDYYAGLNRQVLGYEPPAIMLMHVNRLNAEVMDDLLKLFVTRNYRFVSLDRAQADPAYQARDTFVSKYGPMWGYRWARQRKVKVDGRLEVEPPQWVSDYGR